MSVSISSTTGFDPTALYQDLFKKLDSNSDNSIDKTEFAAAVSSMANSGNTDSQDTDAMFAKLDTNGDGSVDSSEMMTALKASGERMRSRLMDGMNGMPPPLPPGQSAASGSDTLTDDQKSTVSSILSKYDASNLTAADAKAINKAFKASGVPFGKGLGDAVEGAGFSVKTLTSLDPSGAPGSAEGASGSTGESTVFSDLLDALKSSSAAGTSGTTGSTSQSDMFSSLMEYLTSSGENSDRSSSDDSLSSLFDSLVKDLQNSTKYNLQGSLSVSADTTQGLLSMVA